MNNSWARYTLATKSTVAETGDKSATKSTVAPIRSTSLPVLATNRQQLEFDSCLSGSCRHSRQLGRLCCQCVRGQSDTVDFVDFQQNRPCWIQLCRQCIPGYKITRLKSPGGRTLPWGAGRGFEWLMWLWRLWSWSARRERHVRQSVVPEHRDDVVVVQLDDHGPGATQREPASDRPAVAGRRRRWRRLWFQLRASVRLQLGRKIQSTRHLLYSCEYNDTTLARANFGANFWPNYSKK